MIDLATLGRVHILGIGGAGMSAIAHVMLARGVVVSGSDARDSRRLTALRALGAPVQVGHDVHFVSSGVVDTVVISTAIPASNPELVEARQRGLLVLSRAEALAAVMSGFRPIAVSGTHGKTTTTSMVTVALQNCGVDPSFVIGSELNDSGANAHLGTGDAFVVEADESDGSFLQLAPYIGIVTNVEADHLDHYATIDDIEIAFLDFVQGLSGFAVICIDDDGGRRLAQRARSAGVDVRTYGEAHDADYRTEIVDRNPTGWTFSVVHGGVRLGNVTLQVPGRHNVANATAAMAAGLGMGLPAEKLARGLAGFSGTMCGCSMTTLITPLRSRQPCLRHETLPRPGGSWWPFKRIGIPARRRSRWSSGLRSGWRTRSFCWRSMRRVRQPFPVPAARALQRMYRVRPLSSSSLRGQPFRSDSQNVHVRGTSS